MELVAAFNAFDLIPRVLHCRFTYTQLNQPTQQKSNPYLKRLLQRILWGHLLARRVIFGYLSRSYSFNRMLLICDLAQLLRRLAGLFEATTSPNFPRFLNIWILISFEVVPHKHEVLLFVPELRSSPVLQHTTKAIT